MKNIEGNENMFFITKILGKRFLFQAVVREWLTSISDNKDNNRILPVSGPYEVYPGS